MMTPEHLQHLLNVCDWRSQFDDKTLQRGADYAQRQMVLEMSVRGVEASGDEDAGELWATVQGSGRHVYSCTIEVRRSGNWLVLATDCTCPVGVECKHAAAMLLTAIERAPMSDPFDDIAPAPARAAPAPAPAAYQPSRTMPAWFEDLGSAVPIYARAELGAWDAWLAALAPPASAAHTAAEDRRFGILLRADNQQPLPQLLALPAWMRPSKSKAGGALVDPQPPSADAQRGPQPAPPGGWPEHVALALSMLLAQPRAAFGNQRWTAIDTLGLEQALELLLAHYPAYFERGGSPLERGETLALQPYWRDLDEGSQRLAARIDLPDALLLRGAGGWYVQPEQGRYGRAQAQGPWFQQLSSAPPLRLENAAAISQRLRSAGHAHALPAPRERTLQTIDRIKPTPVLLMRCISAHDDYYRPREIGIARPLFDYQGHRLYFSGEDHIRVVQGDRVVEIGRDLNHEYAWLNLLRDAGVERADLALARYPQGPRLIDDFDLVLQPHPRKPPLAPHAWQDTLERLKVQGFHIQYSEDFPHRELVTIEVWHADIQPSGNQWFDVSLGVEVGGQRIDLLPILRGLIADPAFPRVPAKREKKSATWLVSLDETHSAPMPLARLRELIEPLLEWLEGDGKLRLHRSQAPRLAALDAHLHWRGGDLLRAQLEALKTLQRSAQPPRGFKTTLRPYQQAGLAWLNFLGITGLGGILADDMGLGKTVQVLAHILSEKQRGKLGHAALVVAPTSLVGNWRDEAARFAPTLTVLVLHGADRADRFDDIPMHDLVITTYPLLPRDEELLRRAQFSLLVLDEAQAIKNPRSQAARVVRDIPATRRLAMTGTPLENHLGELWAQFDAVEPGLLGSERQFTKLYRTPIEKRGDADRQQRLNQRIGPLLLRRRKQDVLTDLPDKTEIVRTLELEGEQRALYETLRLVQHQRVQQAVRERGLNQSGIIVLDALLKLRQVCCDPRLVKLASAKKVKESAKLDALLELLDGLLSEGRRVLLFSQFTQMLALIEAALQKRKVTYQVLTGQTPAAQRSGLVKQFQSGAVPVFLISLKAGGVGLNLTAADTVIHYDPWWNPAVEAQATDRAHRIGQDKSVFVYRLICAGTVEEKIQAMQARKADLARAVLEGGVSTQLRFDEADLAELFAPI